MGSTIELVVVMAMPYVSRVSKTLSVVISNLMKS